MKKTRKTKIIDGQICSVRGVPLTRASNTMTEKQFVAYILSGLRRLTRFWKPRIDKLTENRKVVTGMGNTKWMYVCEICTKVYKQKNIEVDHIINCGGLASLDDIPRWVSRAFCEKDGYQILCKECHLKKTLEERKK